MQSQNRKFSNSRPVLPQTSAEMQIIAQENAGAVTENPHEKNTLDAADWKAKVRELLEDEAFLERYVFADKHICDAVIRRYLLALSGNKGVQTLGSVYGECALPPVKRPKTLGEAKQLADKFIEL